MEDERDEAGRFRKGVSGNPDGRPRVRPKTHDLPTGNRRSFFEAMERKIPVRSANGVKEMTAYEVILASLVNKAASGNFQAAKLLLAEGNRAAKENEESLVAVGTLWERIFAQEAELAEWRRRHPKQNGGVLVLPPKEPVE